MIGTIMCDVCKRPVDRVVVTEDLSEQQTVLIAYCHGAKDTMKVSLYDFNSLTDAKALEEAVARGGIAFRDMALPEPQRRTL